MKFAMKRFRTLVLVGLGYLAAVPLGAHPLDPAMLELRETSDHRLEVLWRVPSVQPRGSFLRPVLPESCRPLEPATVSRAGERVSAVWSMDCSAAPLVGSRLGVEGLAERETDALVRVHLADGRLIQRVLRGGEAFLTVPEQDGPARVFKTYLGLGFEHILGGLDHLVFVLGLVLLVRGRRMLFWTITAFTVGHSITLSLAALGLVHLPPRPVEVLIAASILAVAWELALSPASGEGVGGATRSPNTWFPKIMALVFGLLHGLGFAGALAEIGLPAGEIPIALLSFNCGIELGQLIFVGGLFVLRATVTSFVDWRPSFATSVPAYAIGGLAAFWILERVSLMI